MSHTLYTVAVWALPVLLAVTLHEASHAYAARYFGDNTAYSRGRMSLNPLRHVDLVGTVLIPAALILLNSPFVFGYAKPVPVNFSGLRNPRRDSALVALAGPASNLLMALLWQVMKIAVVAGGLRQPFLLQMADAGILSNLVLFAFNLFPVPPLDGGRILTSLLPARLAWRFAKVEPYGFFIVLALVYFKMLDYWMRPLLYAGIVTVQFVLYPVTFFLH
ncbi:MAG: site-2 protease family protein [Alistipes senegalensis]|nr:site-2 protease family protein [Oxalobacter formigenes]MCM1281223.1 site-2 protease family protein [Alistipes senegalensis]